MKYGKWGFFCLNLDIQEGRITRIFMYLVIYFTTFSENPKNPLIAFFCNNRAK